MQFPFESVTSLEVSRGKHSHILAGAGIGFLGGTAAGFAASAIACTDNKCGDDATTAANYFYRGLIGAGIGVVAGGVVGYLRKTDEWEVLPLDHLSISFMPAARFLEGEILRLEFRLKPTSP